MELNLDKINQDLAFKTPLEIVDWAVSYFKNPIVTTNFRPYESAILFATTKVKQNIKVIWCDTGYNTPNTYKHAEFLIEELQLNIKLYTPQQTAAHRNVVLGIPEIDSEEHKLFTEQVKLEPFKRAMSEHQPDLWFTNLRKGQTSFRDGIDIVSQDSKGLVKVSPFYNWTDQMLDKFLEENNLPNEFKYYDPTKQLENRECGLHA